MVVHYSRLEKNPADFETALQWSALLDKTSDDAEGAGLELMIAVEPMQQYGLRIMQCDERKQGPGLEVEIPVA